jgi:pilus assembly protein CpaE
VYERRPQIALQPQTQQSSQGGGRAPLVAEHEGHVIVIYSPQGGAGKTTIATNLAASLMWEGTRVLLMDCDLQFGDIGVFLNLQAPNTIVDLVASVDDLDMELVDNVLVTHDSGLKVLLAPPRPEDAEELQANKIAELVEKLRGAFDFIIVDTATKLDDLAIALFDVAERIILVANPTLPAVKNLRTVLNLFDALQYPEIKGQLVFNRVTAEFEKAKVAISVAAIEGNLKRKAIGVIPMDERRVLSAINRGIPVIAKDRNLPPAKELLMLADALRSSLQPADEMQDQHQSVADANKSSRLSRLFGS